MGRRALCALLLSVACTPSSMPVPAFTVTGRIAVEDFREWCDPALVEDPVYALTRYRCEAYALAPLPFADVVVRDATSHAELLRATTREDGSFSASLEVTPLGYLPESAYLEIPWIGRPRPPAASFQIYYNEALGSPNALSTPSNRVPVPLHLGPCEVKAGACDFGDLEVTFEDAAPVNGNRCEGNIACIYSRVAAIYLTATRLFRDELLYIERFHDYCRVNTEDVPFPKSCPEPWLVISGGGDGDMAASTVGALLLSRTPGRRFGGGLFHEFGHFLQHAAFGLNYQNGASAETSTTEPWANFFSTAVRYLPSDEPFREVDDAVYSTEQGYAVCNDNETPFDGRCATEGAPLNQTRAFWDLYDTINEPSIYDCDEGRGDVVGLSFEEMMEGWVQFTEYVDWTDPRALHDEDRVANAWDYVENLYRARHGLSGGDVWVHRRHRDALVDTFLYHNCIQAQPYRAP